MKLRTVSAVIIMVIVAVAQVAAQEHESMDDRYYEEVDVAPEIVGGLKALAEKIVYPAEAKKAGIQGMVIVEVWVSAKGHVDKVRAARSDNEMLTASALEAVRNISFLPGKKEGRAVPTKVMVPVKYKLK